MTLGDLKVFTKRLLNSIENQEDIEEIEQWLTTVNCAFECYKNTKSNKVITHDDVDEWLLK